MSHKSNCLTLRNRFPFAVQMLECVNEESLEDIHPDEVSLFLDQCLADPERMAVATESFFEREAREGWEMGR
jgi:hypothetical protein